MGAASAVRKQYEGFASQQALFTTNAAIYWPPLRITDPAIRATETRDSLNCAPFIKLKQSYDSDVIQRCPYEAELSPVCFPSTP